MIDKDFVLILWKWSCFHQSRNHLFENVLKRWVRFKSTIALNTIWLIDKISCLSNDRIKSSKAFISWFCNILLCSSFFSSESRRMNVFNVLSFTLNILAATTLLSVRFSFQNFFAFFIAMTMKMMIFMILIKKRDLFWFEKRVDNQLENQITAIITTANDVSENNIYQMSFMNQFQSNKWRFSVMMMMINLINDWFWWFSLLHCLSSLHCFSRLKSERFLVDSH